MFPCKYEEQSGDWGRTDGLRSERGIRCCSSAFAVLPFLSDAFTVPARTKLLRGGVAVNRIKSMCVLIAASFTCLFLCLTTVLPAAHGQAITATLSGRIVDASGGSVSKVSVTISDQGTGLSRTVQSSDTGEYAIPALRAGDYTVSVELAGFGKQAKSITLQVGQAAALDFTLVPGRVEEKVEVAATAELAEPTRTEVSSVITERQIVNLPVNGREFIDFALLSPGVTIGDTTSGSTDVVIEPVTKLSFAGQNIHFNFIAVDGADNIFVGVGNSARGAAAGIGAGISGDQYGLFDGIWARDGGDRQHHYAQRHERMAWNAV